jgi:hypothetical protein
MVPPFDIFKVESDGSLRWREAAATLDEAQARVREPVLSSPGEYVIFSQATGHKMFIKSDPTAYGP